VLNYFTTDVVSATGAVAVVSATTAVESVFASVDAGAEHATIPIAITNAIAPTLAVDKIVDKRFALYNALVVKKSLFCSLWVVGFV